MAEPRIAGLWLQGLIEEHLRQNPGITIEDVFEGAGCNPLAIWEPWTVGAVRGTAVIMVVHGGRHGRAGRLFLVVHSGGCAMTRLAPA